MKKSDKVLEKNGIQEGLSWERRKTIESNILLKHIIDNELPHIWRVILVILSYLVIATAGFFLKGIV